jgi:hypothetical protein
MLKAVPKRVIQLCKEGILLCNKVLQKANQSSEEVEALSVL